MSNPPEAYTEEMIRRNEAFLDNVGEHIQDANEFVAGSFQNSYPAWEELLAGSRRQMSKKVLQWIREGVQPVFDGVESAEKAKLNRVKSLLRHAVPKNQIEAYLKGTIPHKIQFQNHQSFYKHWDFSVDAVEKLVVSGTAHLYGRSEGRPKVINPLGVALNGRAERLVLNGMYINLFMKQMPFKYERLRDILTFLTKGGFIATWDLKSGYFHILVHPKYRTYFGFQVGDADLHFNGVCFGWMQACYIFTVVIQEIFSEVRARSIPISSYIDDGVTADPLYGRCLWAVVLVVRLLDLLGASFGLPKCRFKPAQEGEWLGFEIVSREEIFRVSKKKMSKVKAALLEVLESKTITPRQIAGIAGKLISLSPAVLPASLYSRTLFEALQGKMSWDEVFPTSGDVKSTVKEWLENLPAWNGRRWFAQPISILVSSDASDFGFGGLVELPSGEQVQVSGNLTEKEVQMSSTAREVIGFLRLLEASVQLAPESIASSTIQLTGDNHAAVLAINQFRSRAPDVTVALKQIFSLCVSSGFTLTAVWKPRELLEAEDLLSRQPDASDWGISRSLFDSICLEFDVTVKADLFASDAWHVCPRFVSLLYTPGCSGSQALLLDWRHLLDRGEFAWIFPPVRVIPEVVQLVERYRTNCILVVPEQKAANWWLRLFTLHLKHEIKLIEISRGTSSFKASRRVPAKTANPGLFKLRAIKIEW